MISIGLISYSRLVAFRSTDNYRKGKLRVGRSILGLCIRPMCSASTDEMDNFFLVLSKSLKKRPPPQHTHCLTHLKPGGAPRVAVEDSPSPGVRVERSVMSDSYQDHATLMECAQTNTDNGDAPRGKTQEKLNLQLT